MQPKEITKQKALSRLANYCSKSEHCIDDVQKKMDKWFLTPEEKEEITAYLIKEQYIDETRYCYAFIREKVNQLHWGAKKIVYALKTKNIPSEIIAIQLEKVYEETDTEKMLVELLQKKSQQLKANTNWEQKQKLIRFALSRGFDYDEIEKAMTRFFKDETD